MMKQFSAIPIYQQIYENLRGAILIGQLKRGTKLPSTRSLAVELGVSRNTVLSAYDQLTAEGYLETVEGKGTFVTRALPEDLSVPDEAVARRSSTDRAHHISARGSTVAAAQTMPKALYPAAQGRVAFTFGLPGLDAFPYELWARLISRHAHALYPNALNYQEPAGYPPLREAIADYLNVSRQVRCSASQIIMVNGSLGALQLALQVLLNPGDLAWMEDPGYLRARNALLAAGAQVVPVPVDKEGIRVEVGIQRARGARVVYTTPSHQSPLGVTMSLHQRWQLLDWARQADAYILEDDYDSEFRFDGRPLATLQSLDNDESVIYVGTFSKVLFPSLQIGYLVAPPALVDAMVTMRRAMDGQLPRLEQAVLTDFIQEGHFTRHIRRMRTLYAERRSALLELARDLPLELDAPPTGLHLIGWLPPGVDDRAVAAKAAEQRVDVLPVSTFAMDPLPRGGLLLGYGTLRKEEMAEGVRRLAAALKGFRT